METVKIPSEPALHATGPIVLPAGPTVSARFLGVTGAPGSADESYMIGLGTMGSRRRDKVVASSLIG
jgi:tartrate dehydratase beta subunit/fumarate hydratase class I family protein